MRREARVERVIFTHQLCKNSVKFEVSCDIPGCLRCPIKNFGKDLKYDDLFLT